LALDAVKNKFVSGGTAMALFVKTLHNLSRTSSMAATSMLDLSQIPDTFGDALVKVGAKTVAFEKELHSLRSEALSLGYSVDEANEYFKTAQKEMRLTDIGDTRQATEDAMLFAKVMRIDVGRALQYTTMRVNKFGGTTQQATEDLAAITQAVLETNKGLTGTNIHMDKFSNIILNAAENSGLYNINMRTLSNIAANVASNAAKGGASVDQMHKASMNMVDLLTNAPDNIKYEAGKKMLGSLIDIDPSELDKRLKDEYGMVEDGMRQQVKDLLEGVRSGKVAELVGAEQVEMMLGGTTQGLEMKRKEIAKFLKDNPLGAKLLEEWGVDKSVVMQVQKELLSGTPISELAEAKAESDKSFMAKLKSAVPALANAEAGATAIMNRLSGLLQNPLYTAIGALASGAMSVGVLIFEMRRLGSTIQASVAAGGAVPGAPLPTQVGGASVGRRSTFLGSRSRYGRLRGMGRGRFGALTGAARMGLGLTKRGGLARGVGGLLRGGAGGLLRGAGRAVPFLGTAAMLGMDLANITRAETPEAKRQAAGSAVGGTAGAVVGGLIGGPIGIAVGGWLGSKGGQLIGKNWEKLTTLTTKDITKTIEVKMKDFGKWLAEKAAPAFWSVAKEIPGVLYEIGKLGLKVNYGIAKGLYNMYTGLITKAVSFVSDKFSEMATATGAFLMKKIGGAWDFLKDIGAGARELYDSIQKSILGTTYEMIAGLPVIGKRFAGSEFGKAWKDEVYGPKTADGGTSSSAQTGGKMLANMGAMQPSGKVTLEIDAGRLFSEAGGMSASMAR
jgi:hypothetical protein